MASVFLIRSKNVSDKSLNQSHRYFEYNGNECFIIWIDCPQTNTWTKVAPLNVKRCRLGVCTLNSKLYACGGYDGTSFLKR